MTEFGECLKDRSARAEQGLSSVRGIGPFGSTHQGVDDESHRCSMPRRRTSYSDPLRFAPPLKASKSGNCSTPPMGDTGTTRIRITYSFMPDGTSVMGTYSNLYQTLDARAARTTWQDQFRKAAAIWQEVAGFNIVEVPDNGTPVGGNGNQQGDPRFGDIRIGGAPLNLSYLGYLPVPAADQRRSRMPATS